MDNGVLLFDQIQNRCSPSACLCWNGMDPNRFQKQDDRMCHISQHGERFRQAHRTYVPRCCLNSLDAGGILPSSTRLVTRSYGCAARTDVGGLGILCTCVCVCGGGLPPLLDRRWLTVVAVMLTKMYKKEYMHFMDDNMVTIECQV